MVDFFSQNIQDSLQIGLENKVDELVNGTRQQEEAGAVSIEPVAKASPIDGKGELILIGAAVLVAFLILKPKKAK